ncbi:MAG: AEC family transporter [Burkholderiales bacterium]|nr:AEC family transporter [Burkholderiales bacterium]MBH2016881.1 AEC family transporter [Burkholderiales bacterium]
MLDPLLLLPDFLLILGGFLLCRFTAFGRPTWDVVERLVYHLLFPALLFASIVRSPLQPGDAATLAGAGVALCLLGLLLATLLRHGPGVDARMHASGAQVAFRFNSYIALALADRLLGAEGVALIAILIALCVPLCNAGAVWSLARHGGHNTWMEIARNPLIIGTLAGLTVRVLGLPLPSWGVETVSRIGQAALPLGLLAVGAGLKLTGLTAAPGLAASLLVIRHLVLPLAAIGLGWALGLPDTQRAILVAFGALPTASSAYVLAVRMGGHGPFVAGLITVSTLLGMVTVPMWIAVLRQVGG